MKRMLPQRNRRNCRRLSARRERLPFVCALMAFGYLIGCLIGVFVAINTDVTWLTNFWAGSVDSSERDLLTVLCGYGCYAAGMLLLSTSYLGFFLIPGVLTLKGFFSGSVFTVWIRGRSANGLFTASAELLLPGLFLLSALFIMGKLCMSWSVRLFRCRAGETVPPESGASRRLAAVLVLLMLAAAMKTYLVPILLGA